MSYRPPPPVRLLLVGLVLAAVIPLACVAGGLMWRDYLQAKVRTEEATRASARQLARDLDRRLLEWRPALEALASSPELERGDLQALYGHAQKFLQGHPAAINVALVGADGLQILNTSRPLGAAPVRGQPEVVRLLTEGDFAVTRLFVGPVVGRPLLAVAVPVRIGGLVPYTLAVGLSPAAVAGVLSEPLVAGTWTASVLDPAGVIVARVPSREEFVGQSATPEIARAVRERSDGSLLAVTKEGTAVMAAFSRAAQTGYAVVLGVPQDELLAPVRRTAAIALGSTLVVLLLSLALAVRMARRISHAIDDLTQAARDLRRGHVPGAPRLGFQEAEQLRLAMNISAAELQETHSELEKVRAELASAMLAQMPRLIEAGFSAVLVVDGDMRVQSSNAAAAALFARSAQALAGMDVRELFEARKGPLEDGVTHGEVLGGDGVRRAAELRSEPFALAGGKFRLVVLRPPPAATSAA